MRVLCSKAGFALIAVWIGACGARADLAEEEGSSGQGGNPDVASSGRTSASAAGSGSASATASGGASTSSGQTTGSHASGATTTGSGSGTSSVGAGTAASSSSGTAASSSGATGTSSGAGGAAVCPSFGDACTGCLSTACPATYCGCYENPECFAIFQCDNGCNGAPGCQQACLSMYPGGISDAYLVIDCAGTLCPGECPGGTAIEPCTQCLFEDCDDAMNACLAEVACLALFNCLKGCPPLDLACQKSCYETHGAGVPALQAVLQCSEMECSGSCP